MGRQPRGKDEPAPSDRQQARINKLALVATPIAATLVQMRGTAPASMEQTARESVALALLIDAEARRVVEDE